MGSHFQKDAIFAVDNILDIDRGKERFWQFVSCTVDKLKQKDLGAKKQLWNYLDVVTLLCLQPAKSSVF